MKDKETRLKLCTHCNSMELVPIGKDRCIRCSNNLPNKEDEAIKELFGNGSNAQIVVDPTVKVSPSDKTWEERFILKCNTTQITNDGGNSFNEAFTFLVEELEIKLTSATIKAKEEVLRDLYSPTVIMPSIFAEFIEKFAKFKGINLEEPSKNVS